MISLNQIKLERINSSLVEQISYIIAHDVKNPDINFVTITGAKVTSDLSLAKIYFTVLDQSKIKETLSALKDASGYIRHELRERIDIRQIPELEFVYDESIEYGNKIEKIIDKLHEDE